MVRAAARGLLPYGAQQTANWWRRTSWIVRELEREASETVRGKQFDLMLSVAQNPKFKTEEAYERAIQYINDLQSALLPWLKPQTAKIDQATKEEAKSAWTEAYGDLDSPETQAQIAATIKALKYD